MSKCITQDEFLNRLYYKSGFKLVLKSKYCGSNKKINFICPHCGDEHISLPQSLMNGHFCKNNIGKHSPYKKTTDSFKNEVKNIDSRITVVGNYINANTPIEFICSCGNHSFKEPSQMLLGYTKCKKCAKNRMTLKEFKDCLNVSRASLIILTKYDEDYFIRKINKVEYICECGNKHTTIPSILLYGHRCGHCNMSKSEYRTDDFFTENKIEHFYEYKFNDCKNKSSLKFDFYIPTYNTCIELDGEHHYMPVNFKGINDKLAKERHEYTKMLDNIKSEYCRQNKINLIRIPYWEFDNINNILSNFFIA